jgi:PAS domain S-box-containing protein
MQTPSEPITASGVQHDLLLALFEATPDFVFFKNLDGCYVAMNDAGARAIGLPAEEIIGKDDYALFPREVAERWIWEDRQVLAAGTSLTFEDQMESGNPTIHLQTIKSPWRNQAGETIGTVGIGRDISDKKRVERALKEVESRFRQLFFSDLMGIHIPDRFGAITEANDEFLRITGYTREELEAGLVRWDTMTPLEYHGLDQEHIAEAAERGTCTPYEKEYVRKDGTRVPIMCGYTLLEGSQDQYIAFIQDLTAQKKSEEAMRRAEKLTTAGRFAASMAHEINNPLAAVTNLIYLACRDASLQGDTRAILELADRELARISRIVAQTLRFHKQSTAPVQADVAEIMDSVFPLFASRLGADRIPLTPEYAQCERLWCFNNELRHAFANLVGNALDAMGEGGKLRVRVKPGHRWGESAEPGVVVIVADTGSGIPMAMRKRLFEPFLSTKEKTGTGLGLWATENIVRKHRGRIALRTASGSACHGTVFRLFFPFNGIERGIS